MAGAKCRLSSAAILPEAGRGAVDRAMRSLDLYCVVRGRRLRTTIPNRADAWAPDLLDRDFTVPAPNRKRITDFPQVHTYQSFTYVAIIVDCLSQKIVSRCAAVKRDVELVDMPLRMVLRRRTHERNPVGRGQLIDHADAGSQGGFNRSSHLVISEVRDGSSSAGSRSGDTAKVAGARPDSAPRGPGFPAR
ncbi:hypothetical protein JGS39_14715 [Streptomyces sp. P01-B04]|uniref:hypothetical protein n=1 Tax=Streptomyces poriferorum TaxID=2798799 RepID=UPI001C5F96C5|nr:hypothetical protein [Streptomyces poriferorum]MBW5250231.1 hypothetical protein [Streptomyces poriferorum]MBW5259795.1 hypothetical protein [Streptomyces poriferorum]